MLRVLEDALRIWLEGRLELFLGQLLPGVVLEPRVVLDLVDAVESQPLGLLSLDQRVDEVPGFRRPPLRDFFLLHLDLLRENLVPDFFARPAQVWPLPVNLDYPAEHAFVADDSEREVVDLHAVVLPAHDLRSHITWRP